MKRLYILVGANGSGKGTISKVLLPEEDIAKECYEAFMEGLCQK